MLTVVLRDRGRGCKVEGCKVGRRRHWSALQYGHLIGQVLRLADHLGDTYHVSLAHSTVVETSRKWWKRIHTFLIREAWGQRNKNKSRTSGGAMPMCPLRTYRRKDSALFRDWLPQWVRIPSSRLPPNSHFLMKKERREGHKKATGKGKIIFTFHIWAYKSLHKGMKVIGTCVGERLAPPTASQASPPPRSISWGITKDQMIHSTPRLGLAAYWGRIRPSVSSLLLPLFNTPLHSLDSPLSITN